MTSVARLGDLSSFGLLSELISY